jgi:tetratricopeptide (TPR) repeat protein
MKSRLCVVALSALALAVSGVGCARIQAKVAFKEGNRLYKEENFRKAIDEYKRAIELDPNMAEAYFYMGSSNQALYRPGKEGEDNKARLDAAIEAYKASLEKNTGGTENLRKVKLSTLSALTGIYSEDPYKDFDQAFGYAQQLVQDEPTNPRNLFAMANLYEKFEKVAEAEQSYQKAFEVNPQDVKSCNALAAFYNKPLWEGKSKFDDSIATLEKCAALEPNDPAGYYRIAQFFWDKAYRDPLLDDAQKDAYADKGLAEVDKALQMKPDHVDAIVYKGLLFRVKAQVSRNPRLRMQYLDQAQTLQKQALELKKEQQEQAAAAQATAGTTGS